MWDIWQNTLMHMHYVCEYGHMFFSERLYTFVHLYENNYWCVYMRDFYCIKWSNILLQNGHCGPVFYCVAYKCIWLSYKCIYIKVHLMRLMHLCRHYQAPVPPSASSSYHHLFLSSSVPSTLLHFFPWSEFRSATALTHTHDETEWDTIWLRLTHTLGIEVFCVWACAYAVGLPPMMMRIHTPLFTNHSWPHSLRVPATIIARSGVRLHI